MDENAITPAYRIVGKVLDKFRGLPQKLAAMNGQSHQWYSSHGLEPKTVNPLSSGNVSPVEHYMRFARKYEAGSQGAGAMLNTRVYEALREEFTETEIDETDQCDIECRVIKEECDVQTWLAKFDIDKAPKRDLVQFMSECDEAVEAIMAAKSRAIVRIKLSAREVVAALPEVERRRNGRG